MEKKMSNPYPCLLLYGGRGAVRPADPWFFAPTQNIFRQPIPEVLTLHKYLNNKNALLPLTAF